MRLLSLALLLVAACAPAPGGPPPTLAQELDRYRAIIGTTIQDDVTLVSVDQTADALRFGWTYLPPVDMGTDIGRAFVGGFVDTFPSAFTTELCRSPAIRAHVAQGGALDVVIDTPDGTRLIAARDTTC